MNLILPRILYSYDSINLAGQIGSTNLIEFSLALLCKLVGSIPTMSAGSTVRRLLVRKYCCSRSRLLRDYPRLSSC